MEQPSITNDRTQELKNEMLFTLSNRDSGTLAIVVTGSEKQTRDLQGFLKEHLTEYQFYDLDLTPHSYTSLDKALSDLLPTAIKNAAPAEWVINITGLENNIYRNKDGRIEYSALLPQLNFEREQLFKQPQILVLWMSKSFYIELRKKAPDLMHWLSNRFVFDDDSSSLDIVEETNNKGEIKERGRIVKRTHRIKELEASWEKLCLDHEDKERLIRDKINILILLGKEYREAFDFSNSEVVLKKALALSEKVQSKEVGMVYFELGSTYIKFYKLNDALLYYKKSLSFDENAQNNYFLGVNYHQIGIVYSEQREWTKALYYYTKSIEWNEKNGNDFALGNNYHQIGWVYAEQRKYQQALDSYKKAIELQLHSKNYFDLGSTFHQIGMVYDGQQQWQKALDSYQNAIESKMKTGNKFELGGTYHNIGVVYHKQQNWHEALFAYEKAIDWYKETGNEFEIGSSFYQMGMVNEDEQNFEQALDNYRKAFEWFKKTENEFRLGSVYHQIGIVYQKHQNWQEALNNYLKAIEWKIKTENLFELGRTYHQIGKVYEEQNKLYDAKKYFVLAKENIEKFDNINLDIANDSIERIEQKINPQS